MTEILETPRLIGRPVADGDITRLRILHSDARVMATLAADGQPLKRSATAAILSKFMLAADGTGRGVWMFHTRADGLFAGYCGTMHYLESGLNETELLYAVPWTEWKKGYATEMAAAATADVFQKSRLSEIVSFTLPHNAASRRVMEKTGFSYERDFTHAGLPHVLYRLTRTQWMNRSQA